MKRTVPLLITGVVGGLLIVSYFVPHFPFNEFGGLAPDFFNIIAAFAFVLGGGNLLKIHLTKVSRRDHEWGFSIVTVVGFLGMLIVGLTKVGTRDGGASIDVTVPLSDPSLWFDWLYKAIFTPCQATMFALLAFFVASASYRAFRAKTPEATVLLVAAFVVLVGQTFVGAWLTGWMPEPYAKYFHIPNLQAWIMGTPNLAGQRTIQIGIALGIVSNSLRLILGIERSHLGGGD